MLGSFKVHVINLSTSHVRMTQPNSQEFLTSSRIQSWAPNVLSVRVLVVMSVLRMLMK